MFSVECKLKTDDVYYYPFESKQKRIPKNSDFTIFFRPKIIKKKVATAECTLLRMMSRSDQPHHYSWPGVREIQPFDTEIINELNER